MTIKDKSRLYDLIVKNLPVGFFAVDADMRIIEFNPHCEKITGISRDEAMGMDCTKVFHTDVCMDSCPVAGDGKDHRPIVGKEGVIYDHSGVEVPVLFTAAPLIGESGKVLGGVVMFREISESYELEKQRRILISMFAHDLKAPVAIAGGFLSRLLQDKAGPLTQKQRRYLEAIEAEIKRLDGYIHSFLDIVRMEAGQMQLTYEPCSLDKALSDIVSSFEVQTKKKGVSMEIDLPEAPLMAYVDKQLMQRAVANLLDNAIKYSPPGSTITVTVEDGGDKIRCRVTDQGPGINEEDQKKIFDPFFRGKTSRTSDSGGSSGSGLGLAIVKSVVEAHGGRVFVKSAPGAGASFEFVIPKGGGSVH